MMKQYLALYLIVALISICITLDTRVSPVHHDEGSNIEIQYTTGDGEISSNGMTSSIIENDGISKGLSSNRLGDEEIDYDELQLTLDSMGAGGYTSKVDKNTPSDKKGLSDYLKDGVNRWVFIKEEEADGLADDVLGCIDAVEGFVVKELYSNMVVKPNQLGLFMYQYRHNILAFKCPDSKEKIFRLGVLLFDVDLLLVYPVSKENEEICKAKESKEDKMKCFQEFHTDEDLHSKSRLDNLKAYIKNTAVKETKAFVERMRK